MIWAWPGWAKLHMPHRDVIIKEGMLGGLTLKLLPTIAYRIYANVTSPMEVDKEIPLRRNEENSGLALLTEIHRIPVRHMKTI